MRSRKSSRFISTIKHHATLSTITITLQRNTCFLEFERTIMDSGGNAVLDIFEATAAIDLNFRKLPNYGYLSRSSCFDLTRTIFHRYRSK